jgi:PST family polysaccharide transporter
MGTLQESVAGAEASLGGITQTNLKRSATRGALISLAAQAGNFAIRTVSVMILARLLTPKDFGLVGMATAATGALSVIKDAGLGWAMVQSADVSDAQTSNLFWINLGLGMVLAALCLLLSPAIAVFYGVPALLWVNASLGTSFFLNGAGAQHRAILQRSMRFGLLATIDITSLTLSILIAVGMAFAGYKYWALVAMNVSQIGISAAGAWVATRWIPGRPQRGSGIRSMLMFGGTVTLSNIISYAAFNTDKVLLGRFWGAETLGIYGRAYSLPNAANENLNAAVSAVAFPALSRLQNDPVRFRDFFLKGYGLFLSLITPIAFACMLFPEDITLVMLGPKWHATARILRWLAPTILALGLIQPFAWVMLAAGRAARSFSTVVAIAPVMILGYSLGLPWGALGVAGGFSISLAFMVVPVILWAKRGTMITGFDVLKTVGRPLGAITIAAAVVLVSRGLTELIQSSFPRLLVETTILLGIHVLTLAFVMKQKTVYQALLREIKLWPFRKSQNQIVSPVC